MATKKKAPRDINQNAKRIFDEMIERSEQPAKRPLGVVRSSTTPPKRRGSR